MYPVRWPRRSPAHQQKLTKIMPYVFNTACEYMKSGLQKYLAMFGASGHMFNSWLASRWPAGARLFHHSLVLLSGPPPVQCKRVAEC